jgi:hypothetical protein
MKRRFSYILSWTLYYIGHFFSKVMELPFLEFFYSPYTKFMRYSYKVQKWGGLNSPWKENK